MYRLLGDTVVDTDELIEKFAQHGIRVAENITNATKRDDAVALRIFAPLAELGVKDPISDAEEMDLRMQEAEDLYAEKLSDLVDENFSYSLYAYHYDEVQEAIVLNFAMMDYEIGRRKLGDVMKRLFDV